MINLMIVSGDGSHGPISLDMTMVYRAEQRVEEIAIINAHRAPELISCFLLAYAALTDHLSKVTEQLVKAQNALGKRRAIVLLDIVPNILREKGLTSGRSLSGSEDQRNAILELDEGFQQARDLVQQLEAWVAVIKGKQKHIENCYLAVRKIIGDSYTVRNPNLGSNSFDYNNRPPIDHQPHAIVDVIPEADPKGRENSPAVPKADSPSLRLRAAFGSVRD